MARRVQHCATLMYFARRGLGVGNARVTRDFNVSEKTHDGPNKMYGRILVVARGARNPAAGRNDQHPPLWGATRVAVGSRADPATSANRAQERREGENRGTDEARLLCCFVREDGADAERLCQIP